MKKAITCILLFCHIFSYTYACTAFTLHQKQLNYSARTFDWSNGSAYLIKVPIGTTLKSLSIGKRYRTRSWKTKVGTVLITMGDTKHPFWSDTVDGFNQAGLSMSVLELSGSTYTAKPHQTAIGSAQLPAWILSQCTTLICATRLLKTTPVAATLYFGHASPLHYILQDKLGHTLVIEYNQHQLHIIHPSIAVLTNASYKQAMQILKMKQTAIVQQDTSNSNHRFMIASHYIQHTKLATLYFKRIHQLFIGLGYVREPTYYPYPTQWSIVKDYQQQRLYWTTLNSPQLKWIDLNKLPFQKHDKIKIISLNTLHGGDVSELLQ